MTKAAKEKDTVAYEENSKRRTELKAELQFAQDRLRALGADVLISQQSRSRGVSTSSDFLRSMPRTLSASPMNGKRNKSNSFTNRLVRAFSASSTHSLHSNGSNRSSLDDSPPQQTDRESLQKHLDALKIEMVNIY